MSPKNLQPPLLSTGVHLESDWNSSAPGQSTDALSVATPPSILSSTCWMHCSWPAPSFGKMHQWEFGLLQAYWGFVFCNAQVWRIVAPISCIVLVIGHHRKWGQVHNPSVICLPWFRSRWEHVCHEAYGVPPRCTGRRLIWRSWAGRCWPIDCVIPW